VGLQDGRARREEYGSEKGLRRGTWRAGTAHCLVASTEKRSEDFVHPKVSLPQERSTVQQKRTAS
jgi:hypothetical protein